MGGTESVEQKEEEDVEAEPAEEELGLNPEDVVKMTYSEFNTALGAACRENDLKKFRALWDFISPVRTENHPAFDDNLMAENCIKHLRYAFRHSVTPWRELGVLASAP
ncbi:unnamed protein product [Symbiodinium pilosum]|uniref:Uncharacterized protein n=1 Tax=Symbiodinium pilosum TaxID=2952 RepID=A0A812VSE2_SYMPI|nr:unnamed protein product [Symbiodinium pilosum]